MQGQIKEMDEELQSTVKMNDQLELALSDKSLRLESTGKEVKDLKVQLAEKEKFIKMFVEDLHKVYTDLDTNLWRAGIKEMYQTYVTQDKRRFTKEDKERMKGKSCLKMSC
jgi:hypothetical protein